MKENNSVSKPSQFLQVISFSFHNKAVKATNDFLTSHLSNDTFITRWLWLVKQPCSKKRLFKTLTMNLVFPKSLIGKHPAQEHLNQKEA